MRTNKTAPAVRGGIILSALLSTLSLNYAQAATTYVSPVGGGNGKERCLVGATCSGGLYNGTLSIIAALEIDLGVAAGTITRVDDELDRLWQSTVDGGGQVLARARYASDTNYLGYDDGSGYSYLINSTGNKTVLVDNKNLFDQPSEDPKYNDFVDYGTPSWVTVPTALGDDFAFILNDSSIGKNWTSNNGGVGIGALGYNNSGGLDQMVAFMISSDHYIIAWEDRAVSGSDQDYNDFVAEIRFIEAVPVPASLWLFGSAVALLGLKRRRS